MQVQALQNKMLAATGSAEVAAASMAYVRAEVERLGLEIRSTTDSFAGFSASTLRSGLTVQQTQDIFTGVSEAAVSMRLSVEQTQLIFKALEQIAGKGTVSMEELRGQLGDALPGAFEIAAKAMGKTTSEFAKMVANGEVMSSDFLPKFGSAIRKELGGSVDEASKGALAAFNRLGNAFFDLQVKMANNGFLDAITNAVTRLTNKLNEPDTQEGMTKFAKLLGDVASAALTAATAIGDVYAAMNKKIEGGGNSLFGFLFGDKGVQALEAARKRKAEFGSAGVMADNASTSTYKGNATLDGMLAEAAKGAAATAKKVKDYTLGTPSTPVNPAADKAAEKAARIREQLAGQVDGLRKQFASPEDKALMDIQDQDKLLRKALDAKAITEQEYRELSLQAELAYQEQLKEIRQKAWEDDQSALEGFLGIRLRTQEQINNDSLADQAKNFRATISQAAQHNKTFFMIEKAAALARATIAAAESVVSAYAFGSRIGGPFLGAAFAATAAAAQAVNISAIAGASYGGGGGNTGGGDVGSSGVSSADGSVTTSGSSHRTKITLVGSDTVQYTKTHLRELMEAMDDVRRDGGSVELVLA